MKTLEHSISTAERVDGKLDQVALMLEETPFESFIKRAASSCLRT
jgi:hypothetical protein